MSSARDENLWEKVASASSLPPLPRGAFLGVRFLGIHHILRRHDSLQLADCIVWEVQYVNFTVYLRKVLFLFWMEYLDIGWHSIICMSCKMTVTKTRYEKTEGRYLVAIWFYFLDAFIIHPLLLLTLAYYFLFSLESSI